MNPLATNYRPVFAACSAALLCAWLAPACGEGGRVWVGTDLGQPDGVLPGDSGTADAAGSGQGTCAGTACANHRGERDFIEPSAPSNAPDLFAGASLQEVPPGASPSILYPSHETMFPINVSRIRHEWTSDGAGTLAMLQFQGPNTTVRVYTRDGSFNPTAEHWDWIAESNRGSTVVWTVHLMDEAAPRVALRSRPASLLFSASEVEGAIYYWSTGTEAVMKGLVSSEIPVKFYADPAAPDAGTCVACHTLSRDGKRMAVGYGGEVLREVSVPDRATLLPSDGAEDRKSAWTTFSPDGELLLVAFGGVLTLIDADTGEAVGPNGGVVPMPDRAKATHPDWNARGDRIAISLGSKGGDKSIEGGSIAVLSYVDGSFGAPEVLVESSGPDDNNFFPVWSPDSRYLAYVHAKGKSKDAVSAVLRLLEIGGGPPRTLTRLNQRVNNADGVLDIGNSMPTWAPSSRAGVFWLAFSSLREYGTVRPRAAKADQIWIAAVDPAATDPGFSAFWAPFQSLEEGNHRAFWTRTTEDTQCFCVDFCGDDLDNDCDGVADEADCMTCVESEICGDGIDNDCDCVVDECNEEICGDGIDNDGDDLTDEQDPACQVR